MSSNAFYARRYAALRAWLRGGGSRLDAGSRPRDADWGIADTNAAPSADAASRLDGLSHGDLVASVEGELRRLREAKQRLDAEARAHATENEALRASEARYRTAFHAAPVALVDIDSEGLVRCANRAAIQLLRWDTNELEGKPLWHLAGSEIARDRLRDSLDVRKRDRGSAPLRGELRRGDGSTIEVEISVARRADDSQASGSQTSGSPASQFEWSGSASAVCPSGFLLSMIDVSDRAKREADIENTANAYRELFDGAPVMLLAVDAKTTRILECNVAVSDATGYSREELLGLSIFDLYDPGCLEQAAETFRAFLRGRAPRNVTLRIHHKDGTTSGVMESSSAVVDEHGAILICRIAWHELERLARAPLARATPARTS